MVVFDRFSKNGASLDQFHHCISRIESRDEFHSAGFLWLIFTGTVLIEGRLYQALVWSQLQHGLKFEVGFQNYWSQFFVA